MLLYIYQQLHLHFFLFIFLRTLFGFILACPFFRMTTTTWGAPGQHSRQGHHSSLPEARRGFCINFGSPCPDFSNTFFCTYPHSCFLPENNGALTLLHASNALSAMVPWCLGNWGSLFCAWSVSIQRHTNNHSKARPSLCNLGSACLPEPENLIVNLGLSSQDGRKCSMM